jgi:two-component system chemotaxis response regulator CheB
MRIEKKRIYVAPPDFHLLVEDAHLHLWYGPQENMQRPSINVTFRSAVDSNPKNIVGVLLSGLLDDGCMGLWYVKEHGGTVIVQDPKDARYSDMPGNALKSVNVDYCVTAAEIGPLVSELVRNHNDAPARKEVEMESANALAVTCPACHGPISEFKRGPNREYRCLVGHSYGTHEILHAHHESEESALWRAKGHLEESAQLLERVAETLPEEDLRVMNDYTKRKLELAQKIGELLAQLGPFPFPTV